MSSTGRSGDVSLPVAGGTIRPSRAGSRRAIVLLVVHLAIAAHIAHWLSSGRTLAPLEPSEGMQFAIRGVINAGLVFFLLTILSTLVLGRWFCGWACHLVALQDGSRWLLGRVGIKPKAVQLGIIGVVPLVAFIYMFVGPLVYRLVNKIPFAHIHGEMTTAGFWDTFPPLVPALLTFITCGFVAVYLLGAKGFCTYGCPYGAIYGVVDQLAPGRIRVNDDCEHCGHCTAVCSSNVRVHEEVRDYGMVVDPGCMKCLDCVSVCPNDALSFGMGAPAILAKPRTTLDREPVDVAAWSVLSLFVVAAYALFTAHDLDFDWRATAIMSVFTIGAALVFAGKSRRKRVPDAAESAILGVSFLASVFVFRGLYGMIPFLFCLGLSAVLAWMTLHTVRLFRRRDLNLHRWRLRRGGRFQRAGYVFIGLGVLVSAFAAHSAVVQYHAWSARHWAGVVAETPTQDAVECAQHHLERVLAVGLIEDASTHLSLANFARLEGDFAAAEKHLRSAAALTPNDATALLQLGQLFVARGDYDQAVASFEAATRRDSLDAWLQLGEVHANAQRFDRAKAAFDSAVERFPDDPHAHFNLGVLHTINNEVDQAIAAYRRAIQLRGEYVEARENLAGLYCTLGRFDEGLAEFEAALAIRDSISTRELAYRACVAAGRLADAAGHLEAILQADPSRTDVRLELIQIAEELGDSDAAEKWRREASGG